MKFTWFNLMPWPDLPDDFRESQRSVWVDVPSELYDPEGPGCGSTSTRSPTCSRPCPSSSRGCSFTTRAKA